MPTLNRKVTNHGFKEKGTSISKGSGHTLEGFKATIMYSIVAIILLNWVYSRLSNKRGGMLINSTKIFHPTCSYSIPYDY